MTRSKFNRIGLAAILFLSVLCNSALAAPVLKASLDRETISLGETATLSFTFNDTSSAPAPSLPAIANLQINHVGQANQITSVGGQISAILTHNFQLAPTALGEFTIPAIRVNVGGIIVASQPLKLTVVQGQIPTAAEEKLPAFLKLIVPKKQIYVGEPISIELQMYCQDARDVNLPQLPGEGFIIGQMPQPTQTRTRVGGEIYNLLIFKFVVTATRPGSRTLGPATMSLKLLMGPRNVFGQYTQERAVTLTSEPQALQILALPTSNQPSNFNGAIGNFSMEFSAAPTNVAVGDPITLKVKISGRGSLDLLSMPPQTDWREFKTYPATSKIESTDPLGLEGAKVFEQVVVPQNSEVRTLPAFSFGFFDPEQKVYRTLTHPAIPLTVRPTAATPQPTIFSNNSETKDEQPSREIVHIKPQLGTIQPVAAPLVQQPWFWVMQSFPPLFWIGSIVYRRRKESFANNPKLRRQRTVEKLVSKELPKLKVQAEANQSEEFFATVFRLLQEQIGERLDLPASSITEAVVEENLRARGLNSETVALLHELFQTCNQARYAPIRGSQQLASFIPKVEEAIAELKNFKNEKVVSI